MGTLQQVAGAAGIALLVAIMAGRSATLEAAGLPPTAALNGGISTAFLVAAVFSIGTIVLACFIRNTKPPMDEQSAQWGSGEEPVPEQTSATRS